MLSIPSTILHKKNDAPSLYSSFILIMHAVPVNSPGSPVAQASLLLVKGEMQAIQRLTTDEEIWLFVDKEFFSLGHHSQ